MKLTDALRSYRAVLERSRLLRERRALRLRRKCEQPMSPIALLRQSRRPCRSWRHRPLLLVLHWRFPHTRVIPAAAAKGRCFVGRVTWFVRILTNQVMADIAQLKAALARCGCRDPHIPIH